MAKELHPDNQQASQAQQQDAAPVQQPQQAAPMTPEQAAEQQEAWGGSQETAAAKESVREQASTSLSPAQADTLAANANVPGPSAQLASAGGIVGPELVAAVQEQDAQVKRAAVSRAYETVMVGAAAATGSPQAQAALASAPPQQQQAAQEVQQDKSVGAPLPADTRAQMEQAFGQDFSGVQIHTDSGAAKDLDAGAAAAGEHIHFAPGQYDPTSKEGQALIAHELTHVVQQRDAPADANAAQVPASTSAPEQQAAAVQEAVQTESPVPAVATGTANAADVHLGEAGVHRGIEIEAAGVPADYDPDKLTPQQKAALEMYSGNFMRDYSQLAAPMPLKILSNLPSVKEGGVAGAGGARTMMDALVQAIAIMELGKDIGRSLVTSQNIGVYEAEQHIDNPMGTSGAGDFITGGPTPQLARSPEPRAVRTTDARGDEIMAPQGGITNTAASPDTTNTASVHAGSAVPGLQYENPTLYQVSEGGLGNHIYNSTEHAKDRFLDAARLGATPEGRMNMGMGQHIVEDYFSHTNFIEVGLNRYINDAMASRREKRDASKSGRPPEQQQKIDQFLDGMIDRDGNPRPGAGSAQEQGGVHAEFSFVDTLYDQKTPDGRQAVTTGTFGGTDTKVSIGHVLLPKLPLLEKALHKGVDSTFGIVHEAAKKDKPPTWEVIQGMLEGKGRDGAIAKVMLEACNSVGLAVPCPSGFDITYTEYGLPLIGSISVPSGMQLRYTNIAITDALVTGAGVYCNVMQTLETIKKYTGFLALQSVITSIQEMIKNAMAQLAAAVRAKMTEIISGIIIEMYNIDPQKAAHAGVEGLTMMAEEGMHDMTEHTSLESRMGAGGDLHGLTMQGDNGKAELERRVGPVRPRDPSAPEATWGTEHNPWVTVNPLPPSHSEISKDHPPHAHDAHDPAHWHEDSKEKDALREAIDHHHDEHHGHDHDHDHEGEEDEHEDEGGHASLAGGSSFYELHRNLAVEADRHLMYQMEAIWGAQLIPGQNIDADAMTVSHDAIGQESAQVATGAAEVAKRAGFRHAQSDERVPAELRTKPEVVRMLDLVDYFVSHPSASTWWHTIFDNYIAAHGDELYAAILERNKTRGRRHAAGD